MAEFVRYQQRPISYTRGLLETYSAALIVVERSRSFKRRIARRQFDQFQFE
jgi:hypothetical protein